MTALITLIALPAAIWGIDRVLFRGELAAMVRDEFRHTVSEASRRKSARRPARRGAR